MAEKFIPYQRKEYSPEEQLKRSEEYFLWSNERRTVREFSDRPVDIKVIENIIKAASTAPSGANKQPWTFCVVSSPEMKKKIREAAEIEEKENYSGRMSERWIKDLEHFDTNWEKPFLEIAPYLIVVCKRAYELEDGEKVNNYYVTESVGLAAGMLLSAIHHAGLVSLTHTPSPMNFLTKVLNRPENERPFLLIPVGYPAENAKVPNIGRKELNEVMIKYE
ncbi:MAG: nitroreductase family protein [Flavobacteriales bacterium]